MADASLSKSILITAPVVAAAVISLIFGVNQAMNSEPTQTFTPLNTTTRPPTTTTRPPTTTAPATTASTTSAAPVTTH
ncbi:hypothetical protein Dform_02181 [Dehalogenimonas formicexedens]|uniref:Uncharacterized protein n=1 Tax=Dehalogenimonas formicexedens TaxID=1839801 RepID=A0A1P8FAK8_9CHLR|nr:hypothetical protein Dform_02181 [Dehalogenimonas formicexedens]